MSASINISGQTSFMAAPCIRIYGNATSNANRNMGPRINAARSEIVSVLTERPAIVAEKTRIGDWEIDTVIGQNHQGALVTIVDRVSKFTLIKKVDSKHAEVVTAATIILLQPYLDKTLTITADNGKEFAGHETIKEQLNANVYFAHPYCSWERCLNENTNGLIRQYFTKGSSFESITDDEVEAVMNKLNHRPRKTLKFKSPHTVFFADTLQEAA